MKNIRNFCIIAHIDHGKSTLADRFLELTGTVEKRLMKEQLLDTMDLERERGITIKLQPVTMIWNPAASSIKHQGLNKSEAPNSVYTLNLIDTPGHVDFTYEVSRSLAAVEGAILLVDASQGIQAQTLTTLSQAKEAGLAIIPVVNKIDLPGAEPEQVAQEMIKLLNINENEIIFASGKTGEGVKEILQAVIERIPCPIGNAHKPLRALIFDSIYDSYRGVISFIKVVDGILRPHDKIQFMATGKIDEALEVGILTPKMSKKDSLETGAIGYIVTGVKDVSGARIGDTIIKAESRNPKSEIIPLPGYKEIKPMVYAGIYSVDGKVMDLRDALEKLALNDSSLKFEPESSKAFGLGFKCGFLGLLHLEIIKERLEREYNLNLIITTPSVAYQERTEAAKTIYAEPWVKVDIITPQKFIGPVMGLAISRRGIYQETVYLDKLGGDERILISFELPLSQIMIDFHDTLKSVTSGFASMSYEFVGYREDKDLVKLRILIAQEEVEELALIIHRQEAFGRSRALLKKLKDLIPRHNFEIVLQAAIGGKIIARETISALRKDVTAKLYGGDRTRKDKLLKKQAIGKKKLKKLGKVNLPSDVFVKLLKND